MELAFEDGQAYIPLVDGTALSVLNKDREEVVKQDPMIAIGLALGLMPEEFAVVRADESTFEVCLVRQGDEGCAGPIEGWETHLSPGSTSSWTVYQYVTPEMVAAYAEKVGVSE